MSKDKKENKDKTLNKFENRKDFFNSLKVTESKTSIESKKTKKEN